MAAEPADLSLPALVARALAEDIGEGDLTAEATVPATARARARIVQKQAGIAFGFAAARETFAQTGAGELEALMIEGQWRDAVPAEVAFIAGPARALLAAERTALNLLGHLSGIATLTARFVEAAEGGRATILDTRKTTPGLRALEKAAVVAGGARNHRMGLYDAVLVKENHIALAGGVEAAVAAAREAHPERPIEVECTEGAEVETALAAGAGRLLLDNMDPAELERAVELRDRSGVEAELEASGGIGLESVAAIAATGVDYISVGALTHSAPALDFSMLLEPGPAPAPPGPIGPAVRRGWTRRHFIGLAVAVGVITLLVALLVFSAGETDEATTAPGPATDVLQAADRIPVGDERLPLEGARSVAGRGRTVYRPTANNR